MPIFNAETFTKYFPASGEGVKPPKAPGEYRIRNASGDILYTGETHDLCSRMDELAKDGRFGSDTDDIYVEFRA